MDTFEFDATSVRSFAEVFDAARAQLEQVRTMVEPGARAADFGNSWQDLGATFERHLVAIADDLANLAGHLGEVHANLIHGADLVARDEANTFQDIKAIEQQ